MRDKPTNQSSEALFAGCLFIFLVLFLLLISSIPSHSQSTGQSAGQYNGTISQSGYSPPTTVWVQWCRMGTNPQCRSFQLNSSISWDGQSREGKFGRYAGGDESVDGWSSVPAVWGEAKGGEIGAALLTLYASLGLNREYTDRELADFAFSNACGGFLCGCGWYERVTGQPHPINPGCKGEVVGSGDGLRPCPGEPVGCGRNRNNPCFTADLDIPVDKAKQVPCYSGSGRIGRWLIRKEVISNQPIDGPADRPVEKPINEPTNPNKPTDPSLICLVIKIDPQTKAHTVEVCK